MTIKWQHPQRGFNLVELSIVLAISAILATVSFSTYNDHVRKARRADAINTIMSIQLAEEQYRSNNSIYGTLAQVWGGVTTAPGGYYTLAVSNLSASSYTITATATGSQTSDAQDGTSCGTMSLTMSNGTETKTPASCWSR